MESIRGPAVSAALLLALFGVRKYWAWRRERARDAIVGTASLQETVVDLPGGGGQMLLLSAHERLKLGAVFEVLEPYMDGRLPYAALILDLTAIDYEFSAEDLASVGSSIASQRRGWVVPCAIAFTGDWAVYLQKLISLTSLANVEELKIVDTLEAARAHVDQHVARRVLLHAPTGRTIQ
jgi:hypothetical protein